MIKIDGQRTNGTPVGADRVAQSGTVDPTTAPKADGASRRGDSVELSAGASDLAEAVGSIAETLESERNADPDRLQRLRAQISDGSYPQQLRALAEKIVESEGPR